ncbi:unnamed protein product [Bursaphelenchus okinawaensis]|uniref:N-acetyllactosaminide beta-1,3-N-acetylglucosaminyltransferase n=1 Tax=Bursaphelenchus okinawaensis TaxID=465554 RepID=A0A811L931_9BILA|nr:unnamed protein product [Bursaphelenchus okinawaensis]CAG9121322.1 unnamed protein product [Bursaphelenchus okinawaensis]
MGKRQLAVLVLTFAAITLLYVKRTREESGESLYDTLFTASGTGFENDKNAKMIVSKPYKNDFCLTPNYWKADAIYEDSITYVVHSTMPFVDYLEKLVEVWDGPISLAVYVPAPDLRYSSRHFRNRLFLDALSKLETLSVAKKSGKVSIHLLFDKDHHCGNLVYSESQLYKIDTYLEGVHEGEAHIPNYPCQVLRNIARFYMITTLFVASDIENIPSPRYVQRVLPLAKKMILEKKEQVVLVHRRFELDLFQTVPRNKEELKKLYYDGKAVEFHKEYYAAGHFIPYIDEWFNIPENFNKATIFKYTNYSNGEWEPQFIGDNTKVPFYDENFPYPHRGQTEMAYETCRAGYKFAVLNDVYTLHMGIKRAPSRAEMLAFAKVDEFYWKTAETFRSDMDKVYPKTKAKCGFFKE